ncbi:MAG: ATP-binding cassette domain-containing protein [Candidatus Micrarchaeota archaeon]|nr:ATP-binding cassette domain-containing protein [Candidatus Micrarchaeota archaeon]
MAEEFIIEAKKLCKSFGSLQAVKCVDLKVKKGEIFGFLGPNGAGKSTVINMLTTMLTPTSGTARVAGYDIVAEDNRVRENIGIVPQEILLENQLSARENLEFYGKLYHMRKEDMEARIPDLLEMAELTNRANDQVKTFSGGMKRRLEIAKAFMHRPKIIIMDEPTIGLDIQTRMVIWERIRELNKMGITIFITTHYMEEADLLCDRVAIMDQGEIKAIGTPDELKHGISKGSIVEVEFTGPQEKFIKEIGKLCNDAKITENHGHVVKFTCKDPVNAIKRIIENAGPAGVKIDNVSMHEPSLDDVFVHYTGRQIREQSAENLQGKFFAKMRG